jgi:hypothetical protein
MNEKQNTPFRKPLRTMNFAELKSGILREVLEYLEKNTELAKTAIESHKTDFKKNILYIFIGFLLSLIPQGLTLLNKQSGIKLLKEQFAEIDDAYYNLQKDLYRMRLENEFLKNKLNELKTEN